MSVGSCELLPRILKLLIVRDERSTLEAGDTGSYSFNVQIGGS